MFIRSDIETLDRFHGRAALRLEGLGYDGVATRRSGEGRRILEPERRHAMSCTERGQHHRLQKWHFPPRIHDLGFNVCLRRRRRSFRSCTPSKIPSTPTLERAIAAEEDDLDPHDPPAAKVARTWEGSPDDSDIANRLVAPDLQSEEEASDDDVQVIPAPTKLEPML